MNDNINKLYSSLQKEGFEDIGTEHQFRNYVGKPENVGVLYDALAKEGYEDIGSAEEFSKWLTSAAEESDKNQPMDLVTPKPRVDVSGPVSAQPEYKNPLTNTPEYNLESIRQSGTIERVKGERDDKGRLQDAVTEKRASVVPELGQAIEAVEESKRKYRKEHPILSALSGFRGSMAPSVEGIHINDPKFRNLSAASQLLNESERILARHNGGSVIEGAKEAASNLDTYSMGLTEMLDNSGILSAITKFEKGEELSQDEQHLLDAVAINMSAQAVAGDPGLGHVAGSAFVESIPFMVEMMMNPISGAGEGVGKAMTRYALKRFGKTAGSKALEKGAKIAGRVAGDAMAATGMAATSGIAGVAADATARRTGTPVYTDDFGEVTFGDVARDEKGEIILDGNGKPVPVGSVDKESEGKALYKAFADRSIQNFSEMFGEYFGMAGKTLMNTKLGKRVSSSALMRAMDKFTTADWTKQFNQMLKDGKYNGFIGETAEEYVGGLLNAAFVGDQSFKDLASTDNLVQTVAAVGLMSGIFGSVNLAGIRLTRYKARKDLEKSEKKAYDLLGGDFEVLRNNLSSLDSDAREDAIKAVLASPDLDRSQKVAVLDYFHKQSYYNGLKFGENKRIEEAVQSETKAVRAESNPGTGMYIAASRIDPLSGERIPGTIVQGAMEDDKDRVTWKGPDGKIEMILKAEIDPSTVRSESIPEVIDASIEAVRETEQAKIDQDSRYSPEILSPEETLGQVFYVKGNPYIFKYENGQLKAYLVDINGQPIKPANNIGVDDYYAAKQEEIDYEESSKNAPLYKLPDGRIARLIARDEEEVAVEILDRDGVVIDNFSMPNEKFDREASAIESQTQSPDADNGLTNEAKPQQTAADNYSRFVDAGEVSDERVNDIASKIIRGEPLNPEEESMRAVAAQRVEDKLKEASNPINTSQITTENAVASLREESNMSQNPSVSKESPTDVPEQSTSAAIPADENGRLLYHLAPVEATLGDILDGTLDSDEIDAFIEENKKAAGALLKKVNEKPPKMSTDKAKYLAQKKAWSDRVAEAERQASYWKEVENILKESRMKPGDKAAEEIKSMGKPLTGEELAAMMLANGSIKLTKESYKKETGAGEEETKKMFGLFASAGNGGVSIERAGELVMLADLENGTNHFDQEDPNAGRNAVIEVLASARTRGDLIDYVKNNRAAMAERERQAEYNAYAEWCEEMFHMSPEDYEAYEEDLRKQAEAVTDEAIEYVNGEIADEIQSIREEHSEIDAILAQNKKSDEKIERNDEGGTGGLREGSGQLLPEEQSLQAGRIGRTEEGSAAVDLSLNSEDGITQESASGEIAPAGVGILGSIFTQFKGNAKAAIEFLLNRKEGDAVAALFHKDVGDIDIYWGNEKAGLMKIAQKHPEVLDNLQAILENMKVVKSSDNRIVLESDTHKAIVSKKLGDVETPNWLLSAYEKKEKNVSASSSDIETEPAGKENGTAAFLNVSFRNKDNDISSENQTGKAKPFVSPEKKEGENLLDYAERITKAHKLFEEEQKVDTNPSEAQKEAGNYKKGHIKVDGFDITIEQPAGSVRSGKDADGKEWSVVMNNTYGYIRGTKGVDGDHIDVFLGPNTDSEMVYVVDQINPDGSFDEHKVMMGFNSLEDAKNAYLSNYEEGWQGLGDITGIPLAGFKEWVGSSHRKTKPFAEYRQIKKKREFDESIQLLLEKSQVPTTTKNNDEIRFREVKAPLEEEIIIQQAKATGTYMKAPNGKPTNLDERQWVQVRTKAFKDWFGDWETSPEEASKVVDENGEPKVVLHGTPYKFNTFDRGRQGSSNDYGWLGSGFYFYGNNRRYAELYAKGGDVKEVFLSVRSPYYATSSEMEVLAEADNRETSESFTEDVLSENCDGVSYNGDLNDEWVVYDPNQIKSATENIGEFSLYDDDIRFRVVHHGTGGSFDRFSTEKIGTGEGEVAFGWGLYFTDQKEIAEYYAETIGDMPTYVLYKNDKPADMREELSRIIYNYDGDVKKAIRGIKKNAKIWKKEGDLKYAAELMKSVDRLQQEDPKAWVLKKEGNRYIYDVDIPDSGYLNWDKAVPQEYKSRIQKQAEMENIAFDLDGEKISPEEYFTKVGKDLKGEKLYECLINTLGSDKNASLFLNRSGFNGIEYESGRTFSNKKGGEMNYVVFDDKAVRIINQLRYRPREGTPSIKEINAKFNNQLQEQIDGTLSKGHVYHLGRPSEMLLSAGIPDLPIELRADKLALKASEEYKSNHPFQLLEVANLPEAIADPIAIFDSNSKVGSKVILIGLEDKKGNNFIVAMNTNIPRGWKRIQVNSIVSIYPKDQVRDIIYWVNRGDRMKYANKEQFLNWITQQMPHATDLEIQIQELNVATKIIENFQNPTSKQGEIVSEIENLSSKLHTPVTVIKDVNEITDANEKTQLRKRSSKGWYNPKTKEIVIVLPNNMDIADAQRTFLHEAVAHHGLRKLLGDDFDTFLGNIYANANEGIRREILRRTEGNPLRLHEATEEYLADLAERGFDNKEERSLWNRIKDAFIDMLRKIGVDLGFKLSDDDLRYILWRSYRNLEEGNLLDLAEDVSMRNKLGVGEYGVRNNKAAPNILYKKSNLPSDDREKKYHKKKTRPAKDEKIIKDLRERIERLGKNSEQIEDVKKDLVNEIKNRIDTKDANHLNKRDLMSLLRQVRDVKTKEDMAGKLMEVERISYEIRIRSTQRDIDKSLALKTQDVNGKNMSIAKNVDDSTRRIFQFMRGRLSDLKASGYEQDMTDLRRRNRELRELIDANKRKSLYGDLSESESQSLANEISSYEQEIEANKSRLSELKEMADEIRNARAEDTEADLDEMIDELKAKMSTAASGSAIWKREDSERLAALNIIKNSLESRKYDRAAENTLSEIEAKLRNNSQLYRNMSGKGVVDKGEAKERRSRAKEIIAENKRQIVCFRRLYNEIRRSQLDVLKSTQEQLTELINGGKDALRKMTEEEIERGRSIIRNSLDDVIDKPVDIDNMKADEMNFLKKFFSAPLGSFDYMAQRIGRKLFNGEGYIYQYFVKGENGTVACENTYAKGIRHFRDTFEAKTKEIFGKNAESVLYESDKKIKNTGIYMIDTHPGDTYGRKVEKELTKGEAMYLYMVWKMNDGRMKLEKQGVDDDTMQEIEDFIGPQYRKLADWIQEDLLVNLRDKYNERYLEMYDTQMADIPNYVPLRINKNAVSQESNLEDNKRREKSLEERTRSLINRTINDKPVDLTTNGIGVIFEHVKEMEEWYAFARVRRDLDYVLGNIEFRNRVNANAHGHFSNFKDAAILASHSHLPNDPGISDTFWSKLSKGVVGGNIAFRLNTAFKQIYSLPAFLGYSQSPKFIAYFAKNIGLGLAESTSLGKMKGTYQWCIENMPLFYARVKDGDAGNEKLQNRGFSKGIDKYLKAGMIPNKFVDAFTVAIGAKTVYEYTYDRLTNGPDKIAAEEARRQALVDADIFFNQSQQSGMDTFLSPMQRSRSMLDIAFTTYQNSNIGYVRKVMLNFYDLVKLKDWNKLRRKYAEKYISEGVEENKAYDMATGKLLNDSRKQLFGLMLFGWGMNMMWDWGSRGLMGFFAGDDDENDIYKDIVKYLTSPIRGIPIGNIVSNLVEGYDINPVIFMDEVVHAWKSITTSYDDNGIDPLLAIDVLSSGSKLSGFDLEMWGNIYLGMEGAVRHLGREGYEMQDLLFFLNTPKSQRVKVVQEMYKDSSLLDFAEKVSRAYRYTPLSDKWEYWVPGTERMTHSKMNKIKREYQEGKIPDEQKEKLKERKELEKKWRKAKDLSIDLEAMRRYLDSH